jgi:hemolysin III
MCPSTNYGRAQTRNEEIANALSHFVGLAGAIAALPFLVTAAGGAAGVVGASLFGATAVVLYLTSTLYHAARPGRFKAWMNRLDHAAIYLFIAGSYMPFMLGVLYGAWGWAMFGVVWSAATLGVMAKLLNLLKHPLWSTGLYLAMGWVAVLAAVPLVHRMAPVGLAWLLAGGLAYTLGAVVFYFDHRVRYAHFVWHLFVVAGSGCHWMAALRQGPLAA